MEQTVDGINADGILDDICDDCKGKHLDRCVGKSTDKSEYAFYNPDRPKEHRHHDIRSYGK